VSKATLEGRSGTKYKKTVKHRKIAKHVLV